MRPLAVFVVLAVAQFLVRPEPPAASDAGLHRRFPGAVSSILLGSLRPLLLQYLWWDLESAHQKGEIMDVLTDLHLLREVDPQNGRAARYLAMFLAYDLANREPSPSGQMARVLEALDLLETTEREVPADPSLPLLRALILRGPWSVEPRLHREFTRRRGETPAAAAVNACRKAAAIDPTSEALAIRLAGGLRERSIEQLHGGDVPGGAASASEAAAIITHAGLPSEDPVRLLADGWAAFATGLDGRQPAACAAALNILGRALAKLPGPGGAGAGEEDELVRSVLPVALRAATAAGEGAPPAAALSLVVAVHRMQALLDERLAQGGEPVPRGDSLLTELRSAVVEILRRAPELRGQVPEELRPGGR